VTPPRKVEWKAFERKEPEKCALEAYPAAAASRNRYLVWRRGFWKKKHPGQRLEKKTKPRKRNRAATQKSGRAEKRGASTEKKKERPRLSVPGGKRESLCQRAAWIGRRLSREGKRCVYESREKPRMALSEPSKPIPRSGPAGV